MLDALRGVRVLDLTRILAGPYGTLLLADLGAEVLKVERPVTGDDTRRTGPHFVAGESLYFLSVNRGKRSVCIDLARPEGREVLRDLALGCDVVVENFRAGVAESLGCDAATLRALNPRLIVCGMTAVGRDGADAREPAFDLTLQARGGVMSLTGHPGGEPARCGVPIGDLAGGVFAALAVCAALHRRAVTGEGASIDLALLDCQFSLLSYFATNWLMAGRDGAPQGSGHAGAAPYQTFAARDGHLAVAVFTDAFWGPFCEALERPMWLRDKRFETNAARCEARDALVPLVAEVIATRDRAAWMARFRAAGVPASPVQQVSEVCEDPRIVARTMIAETLHPAAGAVRSPSHPFRFEGVDELPGAAAPLLGADTAAVLREVAGYDDARVASLLASGAVSQR
ncbi:MAG: CoA transferase [Polyangiales bacterium]